MGSKPIQKYNFTTGSVGSWTWDIPSDTVSYESLTGITPKPPINGIVGFLNTVHPDDRHWVRQEIETAIQSASELEMEFRLLLPDTTVLWVASKSSVRRDGSNKAVQVSGISIDITPWKTAQAALQRSERELASIIDSLDGIVWVADPRTFQFSFVSHGAEKMLGYPLHEWIENPTFWRDHVHPEDVEWCVAFCVRAVAEGRDHEFEYRMIAADGRTVWLHDLVTVHPEDDVIRGIMLDVTDRKQAEAALAESEQRFRLIFDKSAAGMIVADFSGKFLQANPAFCEFVGRTDEELKQLRVRDVT